MCSTDISPKTDEILLGNNLDQPAEFADGAFRLIYIDPPFNTGKRGEPTDARNSAGRGRRSNGFCRARLQDANCSRVVVYVDIFDDYMAFIAPRFGEARRILAADGTFYFHIDYREAHYCKLLLDRYSVATRS